MGAPSLFKARCVSAAQTPPLCRFSPSGDREPPSIGRQAYLSELLLVPRVCDHSRLLAPSLCGRARIQYAIVPPPPLTLTLTRVAFLWQVCLVVYGSPMAGLPDGLARSSLTVPGPPGDDHWGCHGVMFVIAVV